jgi:hypothetical protein
MFGVWEFPNHNEESGGKEQRPDIIIFVLWLHRSGSFGTLDDCKERLLRERERDWRMHILDTDM